jgi:hypothetical protein
MVMMVMYVHYHKGDFMRRIRNLSILALLFATTLQGQKPVLPEILDPHKDPKQINIHATFHRTGPTVQIGILLDTSGSMSGLINQAKDQLWKIVNEVAKANRDNQDVTIQVGLFEYGKSSLPRYEGYLQMLSPLTSDLDTVSEALFRLRTNGGEEYAGKVILESVHRFAWSDHKDDLKILIIAGNESFGQGSVPYSKAIEKARNNNIIVNTIFCGAKREGIRLGWSDGARIGQGKYFNIDHNNRRRYIPSPYDDEIIALGRKINRTYMSYGARKVRRAKRANVTRQDANSLSQSKSSYIERNIIKSKKQYTQASSDLVTAYMEDEASLEKVSEEYLPDELKGKKRSEIKKIVEQKREERLGIQKQIKELERKRAKFLTAKSQKKGNDLGSAIITSIRKQAQERGFVFKD